MSHDIFDLTHIKQLAELMKLNDLTDIDVKQADWQITLRRGAQYAFQPTMESGVPTAFQHVSGVQVSAPQAYPVTPVSHSSSPSPVMTEEPANTMDIKSPMVGTFYMASSPDVPPFVKVGDTVTPEKTVCLIEAMKVYNEIQAECNGKILAVLVKNGETVEYGKPLFRIAVR